MVRRGKGGANFGTQVWMLMDNAGKMHKIVVLFKDETVPAGKVCRIEVDGFSHTLVSLVNFGLSEDSRTTKN
jgi:hypothetical protein